MSQTIENEAVQDSVQEPVSYLIANAEATPSTDAVEPAVASVKTRTFDITLATTARVVVPDSFLKTWRLEAQSTEASPFLKTIEEQNPDDDDFLLALLKNGFRTRIKLALMQLCQADGLGLSLAPADVKGSAKVPRTEFLLAAPEADPVSPEVV